MKHYGHQKEERGYIRNYRRRFYGRRQRGTKDLEEVLFSQQQREQHQQDASDYVHSTPRLDTESGDPICMRCGQRRTHCLRMQSET